MEPGPLHFLDKHSCSELQLGLCHYRDKGKEAGNHVLNITAEDVLAAGSRSFTMVQAWV